METPWKPVENPGLNHKPTIVTIGQFRSNSKLYLFSISSILSMPCRVSPSPRLPKPYCEILPKSAEAGEGFVTNSHLMKIEKKQRWIHIDPTQKKWPATATQIAHAFVLRSCSKGEPGIRLPLSIPVAALQKLQEESGGKKNNLGEKDVKRWKSISRSKEKRGSTWISLYHFCFGGVRFGGIRIQSCQQQESDEKARLVTEPECPLKTYWPSDQSAIQKI